jgi:hypothetical protein
MTDEKKTTKTASERKPFISYLVEIDEGKVEADATDLVADAVMAVENTGKKATVTVTLTVSPADPKTFETAGILIVEGAAKATLPRIQRSPAIYFATGVDGQMARQDPHQASFFE